MTLSISTLSLIVVGLASVLLVVLVAGTIALWALRSQFRRIQTTMAPLEKGGVLPTAHQLSAFGDAMHQLAGRVAVLEGLTKRQSEQLEGCLQQVGMVRYNPFGDTGGDQSFALALLDKKGSGAVISSLHGRSGTRVYAKPVTERASVYPLTEEENAALAQANLSKH